MFGRKLDRPWLSPSGTAGGHLNMLKENITFVCAHTAKAARFFPAIIVVPSNFTQKCQRRISILFVSGVLCFRNALRIMCYMRNLIY